MSLLFCVLVLTEWCKRCLFNVVSGGEQPSLEQEDAALVLPDELATALLRRMLVAEPARRATMDEVLSSPYLLVIDSVLREAEHKQQQQPSFH